MYGTRDAARNWHNTYSAHLRSLGFLQGLSNPCVFYNSERGIRTIVHGDDYVSTGGETKLLWLRDQLAGKFEIKWELIGPEEKDKKEARILNRVVRFTPAGIEWEADQRHGELMAEALGIDGLKGAATPGERHGQKVHQGDEEELRPLDATKFRAVAARGNYLAMDRPDVLYAAKECCRAMAKPTRGDMRALTRLARYLISKPRLIQTFHFQEPVDVADGLGDSNWAFCPISRKSTSGGALMIGCHAIRCWSKTQRVIALSSGEAELAAMVKTTSEVLALQSLAWDLGLRLDARVHTDAAAALGIVQRQGIGKIRHLDTQSLWLQQKELQERVAFKKIPGVENVADLMTKYLELPNISSNLTKLGFRFSTGRSDLASKLHNLVVVKEDGAVVTWGDAYHGGDSSDVPLASASF